MKVTWTQVALSVVIGAGVTLGWRALSPEALSDDPATVTQGAGLYSAHCASCHGVALEGEPDWQRPKPDGVLPAPPHDVTGHTWHHPDSVLFAIVRDGGAAQAPPGFKSGMPGFAGKLTDREIRATLAYIKSTWPPKIRARQARLGGG